MITQEDLADFIADKPNRRVTCIERHIRRDFDKLKARVCRAALTEQDKHYLCVVLDD